jgi:hypothetical protein
MTNRQLYNLVFENYVQAKRELIREGYMKKHLDEVDFNEIFNKTKNQMLNEKLKSLKRENEMLKSQLAKKKGLKEAGSMSAAGQGASGQGGSRLLDKGFRKIGKFFGNPMDKLTDVAMELNKNSDNYRILLQYISDGTLNSDAKIAKAISFVDALARRIGYGDEFERTLSRGIMTIGKNEEPEGGIFENRKRRSVQKEGLFDMFVQKGGQQQATTQQQPRQVWLQKLTSIFGGDFVNQNLSKMDDKSLSDFFKPINNIFLEGGQDAFLGGLKSVLERTDGLNFKNLNQEYFRSISSQLMLLAQFMNLFKIIETKFGNIDESIISSLYKSKVTNPTQKDILTQLVKKSRESGKPISEILSLVYTYAKPNTQNLAENKKRKY